MNYFRLAILLAVLVAFAASNAFSYVKGRESVFKGIISGTATVERKLAKGDAKQAVEDGNKIAKVERERDVLREKLKESKPAGCIPSPDIIDRMQAAANKANAH